MRVLSTTWAVIPGLLVLLCGCPTADDADTAEQPEPETFEIEGGDTRLVLDVGGSFDLLDAGGYLLLEHGIGSMMLDAVDDTGTRLTTDADRDRSVEMSFVTDALGDAQRLVTRVEGAEGEPALIWTISAYRDPGYYTFRLEADNTTSETLVLAKSSPLQTSWEDDGGLYLGADPATHRILENGSYAALDFVVAIVPGDVEQDSDYAAVLPGNFQGHSVASWNHAVTDLAWADDGAPGTGAWVAGGLTFSTSTPVINIGHNPLLAPVADDGRLGFHFFSAESAWLPEGEILEPGATQTSELYYVHPDPADALAGLEQYADAVAASLGVAPWHRREEGRRVPNGWNSWSGSGSTGGYGTNIDEAVVLENLDIMATELRDWGIDWFQVDDGYQPTYGDWWWREDIFPHGPAWLTQQIRDRGLIPGLWMAPFTIDFEAQLALDHPDWMADKIPLGQAAIPDQHILDLTHPEVQQYLDELFTTFTDEWGFEWLKLDFGYYALFGTDFYDPTKTREEAWRDSVGVIREALGPDPFFLMVGQLGTNYDITDGCRLTLDTMPVWEHEPGQEGNVLSQQGMKPSLRTVSRRWYLQDRVWVNHPDLFFFRSNTNDEDWPRLTATESRTFASFIALTGGIVKIGDRLVDLDRDAINVIRTMIPIYPTPARPLDLFEREFPEVWHQPIDAPLDGYDEGYDLLGLFHWGSNLDLTVQPYAEIPDGEGSRTHTVDLPDLGLDGKYLAYEFWSGEFLGQVSGEIAVEVANHDAAIIALRPPQDRPQFLGWNRQISMGGTVLGQVTWNDDTGELILPLRAALPTEKAPFTYEIAIHVPPGYTPTGTYVEGVPVDGPITQNDGEVLRVSFAPEATGDAVVKVVFEEAD